MLLALDPSVRSSGVALLDERTGKLIAVSRVKRNDLDNAPDGARWISMAASIWRWVDNTLDVNKHLTFTDFVNTIVFEKPQIYRASRSKGDPNQLIGLAGVAMAVVGLFHQESPVAVYSPTPAEWCGQLPKATKGSAKASPRAQRILSRLSSEELALVPDQHDVIDAVGLGLWRLGRLAPRRVLSNGKELCD